jgi:hypothetical protein
MASYTTPRIFTFKASAAIAKGQVVIFGADGQHVTPATGATTALIGIAQGDAAAAEDPIEVALPGGGAKAKAGGTITKGALLTSDGSGLAVATTTGGDRIIGMAMDAAVSGDIFSVEVVASALGVAGA